MLVKIFTNQLLRISLHNRWPDIAVLILYVLILASLLSSTLAGAGQYWDWSFPIFQEDIGNYFSYKASSWKDTGFGMPLGYSSDLAFRFAVSSLGFVSPELLRFLITVLLLVIPAYFIYLLTRRYQGFVLSFIIGIASVVNPAIFYKLLAGHLNYLVAYAAFVCLVYFLFRHFKNRAPDYVIIGILVGITGTQLQFFVFSSVFVGMFLFTHLHRSIPWSKLITSVAIITLLHLHWLISFFVSQNIITVSSTAKAGSFSRSVELGFLDILRSTFAKATLIEKFYSHQILYVFLIMYVILAFVWVRHLSRYPQDLCVRLSLVVFTGLSLTAGFLFNLPFVSNIAPIFRETGHLAPLIILFTLLALVPTTLKGKIVVLLSFVIFTYSIGSGYVFYTSLPVVNNEEVRSDMLPYKRFAEDNAQKQPGSRVLIYPYFKPFGVRSTQTRDQEGFLLNNAGSDNLSTFGNFRYVPTLVQPADLLSSLQYALHKTRDAYFLRLFSVTHFLDLSNIYESFLYKYTPPNTYNNDVTLLQADTTYLQSIRSLSLEAKGIYSTKQALPYIYGSGTLVNILASSSPLLLASVVNAQIFSDGPYIFQPQLAGKSVRANINVIPLIITSGEIKNSANYGNNQWEFAMDSNTFTLFKFSGNAISYSLDTSKSDIHFISNAYSIETSDQDIVLRSSPTSLTGHSYHTTHTGSSTRIVIEDAPSSSSDRLDIFDSFEQGLWKSQVEDCFNYDTDPIISMDLSDDVANSGNYSLNLTATRHAACTWKSFTLPDGEHQYFLGFSYQTHGSKHAVAGYSIQFGDDKEAAVSGILDGTNDQWHDYAIFFSAPEQASNLRIYLYAYQTEDFDENRVYYDNLTLKQVPQVNNIYITSSNETGEYAEPWQITFDLINPTKKLVHIKGATTPFYLAMSESYHPQWQAQFNNERVNGFFRSWVPWVKPDVIADDHHFELNGFLNGWYIDVNEHCATKALCTKNADGSYDMELVLEFTPQRWFYLGLLISGTTLLGCIGYLGYAGVRSLRRRRKGLLDENEHAEQSYAALLDEDEHLSLPEYQETKYHSVGDVWRDMKKNMRIGAHKMHRAPQRAVAALVLAGVFGWYFGLGAGLLWALFLFSLFYHFTSRIAGVLALLTLLLCPMLLALPEPWKSFAEPVAVYVFFFLCITVALQIAELWRERVASDE